MGPPPRPLHHPATHLRHHDSAWPVAQGAANARAESVDRAWPAKTAAAAAVVVVGWATRRQTQMQMQTRRRWGGGVTQAIGADGACDEHHPSTRRRQPTHWRRQRKPTGTARVQVEATGSPPSHCHRRMVARRARARTRGAHLAAAAAAAAPSAFALVLVLVLAPFLFERGHAQAPVAAQG